MAQQLSLHHKHRTGLSVFRKYMTKAITSNLISFLYYWISLVELTFSMPQAIIQRWVGMSTSSEIPNRAVLIYWPGRRNLISHDVSYWRERWCCRKSSGVCGLGSSPSLLDELEVEPSSSDESSERSPAHTWSWIAFDSISQSDMIMHANNTVAVIV